MTVVQRPICTPCVEFHTITCRWVDRQRQVGLAVDMLHDTLDAGHVLPLRDRNHTRKSGHMMIMDSLYGKAIDYSLVRELTLNLSSKSIVSIHTYTRKDISSQP